MKHEVQYTASIEVKVPEGVVVLTPGFQCNGNLTVYAHSELSAEDASQRVARFVGALIEAGAAR